MGKTLRTHMSVSLVATETCSAPHPHIFKDASSFSLHKLIEAYGAEILKCRFESSFTVGEMTPLSYAIIRLSDPELIGQLIELGASVDEKHAVLGGTALHLAALMLRTCWRSERLFKQLLSHSPNINAQDHRGYTALHLVAFNIPSCAAWTAADLLLKHGANLDIPAASGLTPRELIKHRAIGCCQSSRVWETFLSDYRSTLLRPEPIPEEV